MDDSVDTGSRNLPEMLARDLAESTSVFLARSTTAGPSAAPLGLERQSPRVPQREPACAATPASHRATSDTDLCSLSLASATSFGRYQQDKDAHKGPAAPLATLRTLRRANAAGVKNFHLKMESDKDERRVFLNGFDEEDWGSDSSADVDAAAMSSPSVRLGQPSVTTAATSVEAESVTRGGKGPKKHPHGPVYQSDCESWVDLETQMSDSEAGQDHRGGAAVNNSWEVGSNLVARPCYLTPAEPPELRSLDLGQKTVASVPQRRSSLSHQVAVPHKPTHALSTRFLQHQLSPEHNNWNASEPALSTVVRLGRRQPSQYHHHHPFDQLPPSPAPSAPEQYREPMYREPLHNSNYHLPQSPPSSISYPRKSNSISRMPFLTQVNSWLEAGGGGGGGGAGGGGAPQRRCPAHIPASPISGAPTANIRVSTEILENLRIMVHGFPDTMLSTDCLTVQTIQSYARKLRIGDIKNERLSPRGSDELSLPKSATSLDLLSLQPLERKGSFGNLKLMTSLRSKFSSRFVSSPTSSSSRETSEEPWPPVDNSRSNSLRCNSSPSRPADPRRPDRDRFVTALRSIFPTGTDYLLDALYAHLVVYNYINSLCGGFPHLHQRGAAGPRLPSRPSTHFVVPAGVTSLADLQLQEDAGESALGDFYRDAAAARGGGFGSGAASGAVVPSKAAAMLGLGSTNMGQPQRPAPGTLGGRRATLRKTTPPGAAFAASLESEATLRHLRDNIARNIGRLVETVKSCSLTSSSSSAEDQDEDGCVTGAGGGGKELEPTLMRAMCEVVRCYEELNG